MISIKCIVFLYNIKLLLVGNIVNILKIPLENGFFITFIYFESEFSGELYECILEFCDSEIPREYFYGYMEEHIKKI